MSNLIRTVIVPAHFHVLDAPKLLTRVTQGESQGVEWLQECVDRYALLLRYIEMASHDYYVYGGMSAAIENELVGLDVSAEIRAHFTTPESAFSDELRFKALLDIARLDKVTQPLADYIKADTRELLATPIHALMTGICPVPTDEMRENERRYLSTPKSFAFYAGPLSAFSLSKHPVQRQLLIAFETFYTEVLALLQVMLPLMKSQETVLAVFRKQSIHYETGELSAEKVHKVLKQKIGIDNRFQAGYAALVIEHLLNEAPDDLFGKPSSARAGQSFEAAVRGAYRTLGYSVTETPVTGDFGLDLIAQSNTERIGIQCKNHKAPVGVDAVMQAHAGGAYYACSRCVVQSARGFTPAAIQLAESLKVELLEFAGAIDI